MEVKLSKVRKVLKLIHQVQHGVSKCSARMGPSYGVRGQASGRSLLQRSISSTLALY